MVTKNSIVLIENWYALCLAILSPNIISSEEALKYFEVEVKRELSPIKTKRVICSDDELKEMYELYNRGISYKEIGVIFNLGSEAIRAKIYRYKKKYEVI